MIPIRVLADIADADVITPIERIAIEARLSGALGHIAFLHGWHGTPSRAGCERTTPY
jgi:hypothetical protein